MNKQFKATNFFILGLLALSLNACTAISGRETPGQYLDDAALTANVKAAILQDPSLTPFQISVETFKEEVQLSGFVDSYKKVTRAGEIARNVGGVKSVKNNLIVN
ncbi:MAG: BON domain-containing protein [Alphaproteobacteria bacterium]|nr:BON domain-containing protein [Alphaproteobacteria bacterium]